MDKPHVMHALSDVQTNPYLPPPPITPSGAVVLADPSFIQSVLREHAIAINALNHELKALSELYNWVVSTHPEVLHKYVTAKAAIARMEHTK